MVCRMNKQEFMSQLEILLRNIPTQERIEALQYYNDYFEDAGVENEQEVLAALGTPEKVAENIKRDLYQNRYNESIEQDKVERGKELVKYQEGAQNTEQTTSTTSKKGWSTGAIVLCIILGIFVLPIIVPIAIAVVAVIVSLLIAVVAVIASVIFAIGVVAVVLLVTGVILAFVGCLGIALSPLAGLGVIGSGLIMVAVGLLFFMLTVLLVGKVLPTICTWIARGIGKLCRKKAA